MKERPKFYQNLSEYRVLIQDCDTKCQWTNVYDYDVKFRSKLAREAPDTGLFVTVSDATTVKAEKACYSCHSTQHTAGNCPFPATETTLEVHKKAGQSSCQKRYCKGIEVCNNYQSGRCQYSSCRRAHICRVLRPLSMDRM